MAALTSSGKSATTAIISAAATVLSLPCTASILAASKVGTPPISAAVPWGAVPVIASRPSKSAAGTVPNSLAFL